MSDCGLNELQEQEETTPLGDSQRITLSILDVGRPWSAEATRCCAPPKTDKKPARPQAACLCEE